MVDPFLDEQLPETHFFKSRLRFRAREHSVQQMHEHVVRQHESGTTT